MDKPLTALELHYPMIHFLIMLNTCCKPIFCSKGSALQKRQDLFDVSKACKSSKTKSCGNFVMLNFLLSVWRCFSPNFYVYRLWLQRGRVQKKKKCWGRLGYEYAVLSLWIYKSEKSICHLFYFKKASKSQINPSVWPGIKLRNKEGKTVLPFCS